MHTFFLLADSMFHIYLVLIIEAAGTAHSVGLQFLLITVPHKNVFFHVFPCFFLNCKANVRVKLAKTGHGLHSSTLVVICVVLCIVCV